MYRFLKSSYFLQQSVLVIIRADFRRLFFARKIRRQIGDRDGDRAQLFAAGQDSPLRHGVQRQQHLLACRTQHSQQPLLQLQQSGSKIKTLIITLKKLPLHNSIL